VKRAFDPAYDMPDLLDAMQAFPELRLMMIDPLVSASAGDSHKNAETRRGLQPVIDLASELGAAVLGITHFTKNTQGKDPLERVNGTLAYGALARIVHGAAKSEDEDGPRRFVRVKSNIGPQGGGFEYLLRQDRVPGYDFPAQRVTWGRQLTGSARDLLEELNPQGHSERIKATVFLEQQLKPAGNAGVPVKALKAAAEAHSLSWRTVERAKATGLAGKIDAKKTSGTDHGQWHWIWLNDEVSEGPVDYEASRN